jgi:hypothetical protein
VRWRTEASQERPGRARQRLNRQDAKTAKTAKKDEKIESEIVMNQKTGWLLFSVFSVVHDFLLFFSWRSWRLGGANWALV